MARAAPSFTMIFLGILAGIDNRNQVNCGWMPSTTSLRTNYQGWPSRCVHNPDLSKTPSFSKNQLSLQFLFQIIDHDSLRQVVVSLHSQPPRFRRQESHAYPPSTSQESLQLTQTYQEFHHSVHRQTSLRKYSPSFSHFSPLRPRPKSWTLKWQINQEIRRLSPEYRSSKNRSWPISRHG